MTRPSTSGPLVRLIEKLIPGIRYPWLLLMLGGLFIVDLVVPDPVPLLDEVVLAALTVLAASWRGRRDERRPPPRDVTPPDEIDGSIGAASGRTRRSSDNGDAPSDPPG
jgi:hypothetical protein